MREAAPARQVAIIYERRLREAQLIIDELHVQIAELKKAKTKPGYTIGAPLSKREIQVLQAIADTGSREGGAEHLEIALNTVKSHLSNVARKLDSQNTTESVVKALRAGIIE